MEKSKTLLQTQCLESIENCDFDAVVEALQNHRIELEFQEAELARTTRSLAESRENFELLRENAPVAYIAHDSKGDIFESNRRARDLLGLQPTERPNLRSLLTSSSWDLFEYHVNRVGSSREPFSVELNFDVAGEQVVVLAETSCLEEHFQTVMVDISAQKKTERDRAHFEMRMQQSQKLELLYQLSGGIAHDFNNLLQILVVQSDLALQLLPEQDTPVHHAVEEIVATVSRGAELTSQLMAFSRKSPLEKSRCDVNRVIESCLSTLGRSLGDQLNLTFEPAADPLGVWIDKVQFEQLLLNLCLNARDASDGEGMVVISTKQVMIQQPTRKSGLRLFHGPYVVMSVTDDGHGISDSTATHMFEPFYTTKEPGKGTGLGLAIVHNILRQHDGAIEVTSSPGAGTTIDVYLPRFNLMPESQSEKPIRGNAPGIEEGNTILVADDEAAIRESLQSTLASLGLNVLVARDGDEAIDLIDSSNRIDFLLSDIVMPGRDGLEVCTHFRSSNPEGVVVLMSGHGDSVLDQDFLMRNNATFLPKPFKPQSLRQKLGIGVRR